MLNIGTKNISKNIIHSLHGRQKKVLEMIAFLNLPKGSSCLELGTGGGQNALKYSEMG